MTEFSFTFFVPGASHADAVASRGFFGHRTPASWLEDLARCAGIPLAATEDDFAVERVTVHGDESALRFACVAFNLHAEQAPWDSTPAEQGAALERVLAGEPVANDVAIVAALREAGLQADHAFTPSRVEIAHGTCVIYATTEFNREDGGWEAVYDAGGDQTGLEDGPGLNATTAEVVAWLRGLYAAADADGQAL